MSLLKKIKYFKWAKDAKDTIIEHDDEWIDFYLKSRNLSQYSKVFNVPLNVETQNKKERYSYQGLDSVIADKKFSVISIDGPFGSEEDSRTDILPFLPQILEDQFVIIMDDTQRTGEKQTLAKIMDILDKSGAKVFTGNYSSLKNCTVITSEKYRWICTM